jgi:hypothetical protein
VADTEPPDEVSASAAEPARWPDTSRPIMNEQLGYPQQGGYQQPPGYELPLKALRRRVWPTILIVLMLLMAILVTVWLLWWR